MSYFDPSLWFLLPLAVLIASLAISAGISGSNFWIPVYMMWLQFEPKIGFWLSLLTMLFGFGSGTYRNLRARTVHWPLVRSYLMVCVPAGVVGGVLSPFAPQQFLLILFAVFVTLYGGSMIITFYAPREDSSAHNRVYRVRGFVAGFLQGLIATGLGKLLLPCCLHHRDVAHHTVAVGTTVVTVFIVTTLAVLARLNASFVEVLVAQRYAIIGVMIWVAPGVVLGGQLGPRIVAFIPKRYLKLYVGGMLILVGGLIFVRIVG